MTDDEPQGPPEPETFPCGWCRKPVLTFWAPGHRGLLRGDYDLVGDCMFHPKCWDALVNAHPIAG